MNQCYHHSSFKAGIHAKGFTQPLGISFLPSGIPGTHGYRRGSGRVYLGYILGLSHLFLLCLPDSIL